VRTGILYHGDTANIRMERPGGQYLVAAAQVYEQLQAMHLVPVLSRRLIVDDAAARLRPQYLARSDRQIVAQGIPAAQGPSRILENVGDRGKTGMRMWGERRAAHPEMIEPHDGFDEAREALPVQAKNREVAAVAVFDRLHNGGEFEAHGCVPVRLICWRNYIHATEAR